jgi:hypothetical protein
VTRRLVAALAAAAIAASCAAAGASKPSLRLASRAPLKISGRHFAPREHVRVRVLATKLTRRAVATSAGSFTVSFGEAAGDPCSAFTAVARGSAGSRALLKVPPRECPPA